MEEKTRDALIAKAERTHRLSSEELAALLADAGAEEALAEAEKLGFPLMRWLPRQKFFQKVLAKYTES